MEIALQVLQRDGHRYRRLVDFIDQRSEVRGTMLKSFEYISLIFHPRVTFDTLDYHRCLQMVSSFCEILYYKILCFAHFANHTVSWISFVIVYVLALPFNT